MGHDHEPQVAADARVEEGATLGPGTVVWWLSQVRAGAVLGRDVSVGRNVYVDADVTIGDRVRIQNNALIYGPAVISEDAFLGPACVLTNDVHPRAVTTSGHPKGPGDWEPRGVHIGRGASVGAGVVVVAGVRIGDWAMVGAGATVVGDLPDHALAVGTPARRIGWVGRHGTRLVQDGDAWVCPDTGDRHVLDGPGLRLA